MKQRFFFHRVNGGLDFPRQFPDDHCQASARSKSHWGVGSGAPVKMLGYINVVQVKKVVENILYIFQLPLYIW